VLRRSVEIAAQKRTGQVKKSKISELTAAYERIAGNRPAVLHRSGEPTNLGVHLDSNDKLLLAMWGIISLQS